MEISRQTKSQFKDIYNHIDRIVDDPDKKILLPYSEKAERVERSKHDSQFFFQTYLSDYFKKDPAPYHSELPSLFKYKQRPLVILAPRGGAKSTFLFGETLRLLATGQQRFMVRVEINEAVARKEVFKIRNEIERNEQLFEDFGDLKSSPWGALELYFSNGCMLWGRGSSQPIRGTTHLQWRPTGIVYNDVETYKQVQNQTITDEIHDALFLEALPALNPRSSGGGFLAVVGTLLGKDSMLNKLRHNPRTRPIYYEALEGDPQTIELLLSKVSRDAELSFFLKDIEGESEEDQEKARSYFRDNEDYAVLIAEIKSYWPSQWPVEDLLLQAAMIGIPKFKQEYLHIPINSDENSIFDDTWFDRLENSFIPSDIPLGNLVRATFLDPSYRDTATSDNQAFITGFYDIGTQCGYIVDVTAGKMSFETMIETSFRIAKKFLIGDVRIGDLNIPSEAFVDSIFGFEDNGAQQWLNTVFRDNVKNYKFHLPKLTGVGHTGNKHIRISRLSYYIEKAKIKLDMNNDNHILLKNELCSLGNRKVHDDRADALEGWWGIVEKIQSHVILASKDQELSRAPGDLHKISFREPIYDNRRSKRLNIDRTKKENNTQSGLIF